MKTPVTHRRDELTPTGANTSRSFKCSQCGVTYSASDVLSSKQPPKAKLNRNAGEGRHSERSHPESRRECMTCPSCGFENCIGDSKMIDISNEDY